MKVLDRSLYAVPSGRSIRRRAPGVSGPRRSVLNYLKSRAGVWVAVSDISGALDLNVVLVFNSLEYLRAKGKVVDNGADSRWRRYKVA